MGDQRFASPASEGSAATQEKGGLEQTGLARSIRSYEKIRAGVEFDLDLCEAAEPLGAKTAEWHAP